MNKTTILDEALKKGYVLLHITKVVVSGSAGNGKTHTKYVLFNELGKLSLIRKSTPLFDDPIRALSRELVGTDETGCEWFRVTYDELNQMLAQSIEEGVDMEELPQPSGFDEETQVSDASIKAPEKVPQETTHSETKVYEKEKPMKQVNTEDTLIKSSAPNISQCSDPNVISESGANVSLQVQSHHSHQNPTNESDTKVLNVDKEVPSKSSRIATDSALIAYPSPVQLATEDPRSVTKTTASVIEITDDTLEHSQTNVPSKAALPITVDLKSSSSVSRLELLQVMESKTKSKPLHLHWIQFIDSGGQPQFHELLQAFIRNTSVVMIVLKLSESLDFFPEIAYYDRQTGLLCGNMYTSSLRNDQIIQRCIRTLSKDKQSRVLVVGTHLDLAHKSPESIEDKNKRLLEMLTLALGKKLITRTSDKVVFPLNALTPGEDDRKVAGEIRGEIAKDKHLSEPYKVPIAWFLLEQDMQKLERSVVNLHTCYQLGSILHMTKTTVNAALDYFHELNIILYYPSILPNVVFVSPQVIVDKVTELIECSLYLRGRPESEEVDSDERWQTFIDHGELSVETLADPKFFKHFVPELFTPHQLLLVFQNLFIVAPISDTIYFMPSLLPEILSEELEEYRPTTDIDSPVLVYFPDGCCPGGAFCCLCVYLISKCGWKTEGKLFRNYLMFHVGCENHEVVIIDAFHYFEVYLNAPSYVAFEISSTILHHIKSGLKEAATSLHQEEIRYHFAVLCPSNKESTCDSSPHAAVVSNTGQYWTCTKDPKFTGELDKQQATWFSHSQQLETLKKENQDLKEEQQSQQEKDIQIQQLQKIQEQHSAIQQEKDIQIQQLQEQHSAVQQEKDIQIQQLQKFLEQHSAVQQEKDIQIQQLQEQHSAVQQEKDIQIQQLQEQHSAVQQEKDIQIQQLQEQHSAVQHKKDIQIQQLQKFLEQHSAVQQEKDIQIQQLQEQHSAVQQEKDIQIQQLQEQHSAVQQEKDIQIQQLQKIQEQHSAVQLEKDIQIEKLQQQLQELEKQLKQQQEDEKESSTLTLTLPGAQLISTGKLTIERSDELQTLEWKNHGLKVHVPPGTLPDSEDTCDIDVATSFSGSFILPEDHTFVSAIYYIRPAKKLAKLVTLEIEHCCSIKNENDAKSIVPIHAQCSSRNPPYVFQPLDSCTITPGSFYGSFEVSTFSLFSLSWIRSAINWVVGSNTQQEDAESYEKSHNPDSNPPIVYSGQLYYQPEDSNQWFIVKLIVFRRLKESHEVRIYF